MSPAKLWKKEKERERKRDESGCEGGMKGEEAMKPLYSPCQTGSDRDQPSESSQIKQSLHIPDKIHITTVHTASAYATVC